MPHYQLVVDRGTTLARLEVQVEPAPSWSRAAAASAPEHPGDRDAAAARRRQLRRAIGLSVELTLVAPRTIPRSEGKAVRVVERG